MREFHSAVTIVTNRRLEYHPEALRAEIRELVRERLAEYEYPREIEFVETLPKTTTGKIRRAALRERQEDAAEAE